MPSYLSLMNQFETCGGKWAEQRFRRIVLITSGITLQFRATQSHAPYAADFGEEPSW
jgi:hypothetical protein